jgi:hypothetical protein
MVKLLHAVAVLHLPYNNIECKMLIFIIREIVRIGVVTYYKQLHKAE